MDGHERDLVLAQIKLRLITTYGLVMKILQDLPLPISSPLIPSNTGLIEVYEHLIRTYEILADQPIDAHYREHIRGLILDWVTAADYILDAEEDYALWKLDFAVTQLHRIANRIRLIKDLPPEQKQ